MKKFSSLHGWTKPILLLRRRLWNSYKIQMQINEVKLNLASEDKKLKPT